LQKKFEYRKAVSAAMENNRKWHQP